MKQFLKTYNLFFIFMCIIWPPFRLYIFRADGAGRTILILSILAILLNLFEFWKNKKFFCMPAFLCWTALLCYSMWNVVTKGFSTEFSTFKFFRVNFFDSFVFLIIAMLELSKDKEKTLWTLWIALGVYLLIGLPSFGSRGDEGRYGIEGIGNLYPLHAVSFLFVSLVLFAEEKINRTFFLALAAVISVIILFSGTRKAFGAEAILLLGFVLNNGKKKNVWTWIRIVVFGTLLVFGVMYVMNHTVVGERILASEDDDFYVQLVENDKINDYLMLLLGDRAIMYELGIELFHENFLTGIGLTNFMDVTRYEQRIHSEYIVQLCENGFIGFVLLMLYYVLLIIGLVRNREEDNKNKIGLALFGLIALLFLNLTSWTYCQNFAMVFYAILLMYAYSDHKINNVEIEKNENRRLSKREQFQQSLDKTFGTKSDSL